MPLSAQDEAKIRLDFSDQLFTVLCALRAGAPGLTDQWETPSQVETRVDRALRQLDPSVTAPLREFLAQQRFRGKPEQVSNFISLGLLVNGPPDFEFWLPIRQLPPDVAQLTAFQALLKDFYSNAGIEELWRSVRNSYQTVFLQHQPEVIRRLFETRAYLRLIGEESLLRSYTVYIEWLVPLRLVSLRNYGQEYFLVLHPMHKDFADLVRHQYLHYLLDSLVAKHGADMHEFALVSDRVVDRIPRLAEPFKRDWLLLVGESIVQAVEVELQNLSSSDLEEELDRREKDGFVFVRHFYQKLEEFEQSPPSIRFYFPELLRGYPYETERARLLQLEFAPAEEASTPPPVRSSNALTRLLLAAQDSLREGKFEDAKADFERVLQEFDPKEARALYGLGLVYSELQDRRMAAEYFERSLESGMDPNLAGWANIYLARIHDLEGDREAAVARYREALRVGAGIQRVEEAARNGLQRPFGSEGEL